MRQLALVSVVIPCYGSPQSLSRALDSISLQSLLPLEVIIVSDGNSHEGKRLIEALALPYEILDIQVIHLPMNVGAGEARNVGWNVAKGKYVAFLDIDDIWHSRKIELQYGFMEANPHVDVTGHSYVQVQNNQVNWPTFEIPLVYKGISAWQLYYQNQFITPSVMLKIEQPVHFAKGQRYAEDYRLWLELAVSHKRIVKLDAPLAGIFKPLISAKGLSSNLLQMEWGEIKAYIAASFLAGLHPLIILLIPFSILKFLRRLLLRFFKVFY